MITEDEACRCRCCGPTGCGEATDYDHRFCVASRCMAWRWGDPRPKDEVPADALRRGLRLGYCGLAGKT